MWPCCLSVCLFWSVNIVDGIIGDQLLSSVFPRAPPPSLSLSPATPTVDGAVDTSNPIERLTALWQSILGVFTSSSSTPTSTGAESDVVAALSAAVPPPLAAADAQVEMAAVGAAQQTAVEGAVGAALGLAPAQAQLLVGVEILFLLILQVVVTQLSMATLTKLILEPSGPAAGGSGSGSNDGPDKREKG